MNTNPIERVAGLVLLALLTAGCDNPSYEGADEPDSSYPPQSTEPDLSKNAARRVASPWIDPYELRVGAIYRVSKDTPLMPEFEPRDPLRALEGMKTIRAGGSVRILSMRMKRSYPWYYVTLTDRAGQAHTGWINSIALAGQSLEQDSRSSQTEEGLSPPRSSQTIDPNRYLRIISHRSYHDSTTVGTILPPPGILHIVGEVSNDGSQTIRGVKVGARCYNRNGNILGTGSAYAEPADIPAHGSASFNILVIEPEVYRQTARYKLEIIGAQE
ncbi:MAG: FxLYD domain-containing protein [bacterium]|nr:FxLYD domain-containing protein [bacterium]